MADEPAGRAPRETAADAAGARATEAFGILGNETRLSIILALWKAFEPFAEENTVPFEGLQERVGVDEESQFTYHLQKLTGRYVRETDDGYELRPEGQQIIQTVIAGTGIEDPELEPTELGEECHFCGAPTAVTYRDGWLCIVCTDCEGAFGGREDTPDGLLSGGPFPPAGLTDRSPEEMFSAYRKKQDLMYLAAAEGVCHRCTGPMEGSLDVCDDHETEGTCAACGRQQQVQARFQCRVCKTYHGLTPVRLARFHPAVIGFANDHGDRYLYDRNDSGQPDHYEVQLEEDPLRVRIHLEYDGEEIRVVLDDALDVVEVEHPGT